MIVLLQGIISLVLLFLVFQFFIEGSTFFQQEHYHFKRFIHFFRWFYIKQWWIHFGLLFLPTHSFWYFELPFFFYFLYLCFQRKKKIIPFKWTKRMIRFFAMYIIFLTLVTILFLFLYPNFFGLHLSLWCFIYFSPFLILFLGFFSVPMEHFISLHYAKETKKYIETYHPHIIGITGSCGKTSIKHLLYETMRQNEEVYISPKSYNTLNGLSKTIHEIYEKRPQKHVKLLLEMGASHVHDIENIVKRMSPKDVFITSILPQHLESFKTMENLIHEKMQIIAGMKKNGLIIANYDYEAIRKNVPIFASNKNATIISYSTLENRPYEVSLFSQDIEISLEKTTFTVQYHIENKTGSFFICTPLLGRQAVENLLAIIGYLLYQNYDVSFIQSEFACLKPYPHRLSKTTYFKNHKPITILDDAYNSNVQGFLYALEVLNTSSNMKVLITPGIVEGGEKSKEMNETVAMKIIETVDLVILVSNPLMDIYIHYFEKNHFSKYIVASSFQEAIHLVEEEDMTILIENDLTDNYFL